MHDWERPVTVGIVTPYYKSERENRGNKTTWLGLVHWQILFNGQEEKPMKEKQTKEKFQRHRKRTRMCPVLIGKQWTLRKLQGINDKQEEIPVRHGGISPESQHMGELKGSLGYTENFLFN